MIYSQVALLLIGAFWAPWWWVAVVGLLYGWRFHKNYKLLNLLSSSFFSGFIVWFAFCYYYDLLGGGRVGSWMAQSFHLGHNFFVYLTAGVLSGLVTAFSCYVGTKIYQIVLKKN